MAEDSELRKKVLLRLVGHPVVLGPMLLGASASTALWTLNGSANLGWFTLIAGLITSLGAYLTRVILDNGRTARVVLAEVERSEKAARESALDDLDKRMVKGDKDPRPETALRDLRALLRAFEETASRNPDEEAAGAVEVHAQVRELFDRSVRALEQTQKLHDTARQLRLPEARQPLLDQREQILRDVHAGIQQLGNTLVALQQLGSNADGHTQLARLREELDRSLEVAHRVEDRLNNLFTSDVPREVQPTLHPTPEQSTKGD